MKETSKERLISALCAVASIGAFLLIWYLACALTALGKLLPDPVTVLVGMWGYITGTVGKCSLLMHAVHSLRRVLIGFVIGSAIGISLGLLMGRYRLARAIFNPIFRIIRPIPPIAWIPIAILWLGGRQVIGGTMQIGALSSFISYIVQILMIAQHFQPVQVFVQPSRQIYQRDLRLLHIVCLHAFDGLRAQMARAFAESFDLIFGKRAHRKRSEQHAQYDRQHTAHYQITSCGCIAGKRITV